jgi:hypothetical protein
MKHKTASVRLILALVNRNPDQGFAFIPVLLWTLGSIAAGVAANYIYNNPPFRPPGASSEVTGVAGPNQRPDSQTGQMAAIADTGVITGIGTPAANTRCRLAVTNPDPGNDTIGRHDWAGSYVDPGILTIPRGRPIVEGGTCTGKAKTDGRVIFAGIGPASISPVQTPGIIEAKLEGLFTDSVQFDSFTEGEEGVNYDFDISVNAISPLRVGGGYTIKATPDTIEVVDVRGIISRSDIQISGRGYRISKPIFQTFNALTDTENPLSVQSDGTAYARAPEPTSTLSLLALGTLGAASTFKRKLKPSKSSEKETSKVG